jgi:Type IV secretion-system coupling protein DNA-binding domain
MLYRCFRPFERHLERKPFLNLVYAAVEMGFWFVLACLFSMLSLEDTPDAKDGVFILNFLTVPLHLILFYTIHRHIYNYEYPKMLPHLMKNQETHPLLRLWVSLIGGHLLFLVLGYTLHWIAGVLMAFFVPFYFRNLLTRELPVEYVAGTKPILHFRVAEHYEYLKDPEDPGIFFGGVYLPTQEMTTHMKIVGGTRSGKTNILRLFMQSALPHALAGTRSRALIYDPKTEFAPLLAGMGIPENDIMILNPFDARGYAWDMAKDLTDDRDAESLAQILVPENPNAGSGRFFDDATRILLGAVAKLFMEVAPGRWTLRDLILACESIEIISILLENDPDLRADLRVVGSGDTAGNVMATVASVTRRGLKTVASYLHYHHSQGRTFTLQDWMSDRYILLLGCDRRSKATLQPLNQLLMTRVSQLLTSQRTDGYTFLILDELPELGSIGDIDRVAKLGASYQVCLCIAFQAYSDLEKIYGKETANSLIGQCDKSAYLRVLDAETAEWQARQIGQTKVRLKMKSYGAGFSMSGKESIGSDIYGVSEQQDKDYPFPQEFFTTIKRPDAKEKTGLTGVYRVSNFTFAHQLTSRFLSENMLPESPDVADFIEIEERLKLPRWTREDAERLNFAHILRGVRIERLEGTDLYHLLSHAELDRGFELAPIPLPGFLMEDGEDGGADGEGGDGEGGRSVEDDQDYNSGYPPPPLAPKPGRSPRR